MIGGGLGETLHRDHPREENDPKVADMVTWKENKNENFPVTSLFGISKLSDVTLFPQNYLEFLGASKCWFLCMEILDGKGMNFE